MTDPTNKLNLASLKTQLDANSAKIANNTEKLSTQKAKVVEQGAPIPKVEIKVPVPEVKVIPEKMYHVFYSGMTSCRMITTTGRIIAFVLGKYITDVQADIDYLEGEIRAGSSNLSVKPGEEVMSASDLDPMASLRKKYFKEFAEAQKEVARKIAAGESLTQSESEVQQLTPGSTSDIAALTSE